MGEILFLTHRPPYPPDRGDKIRSWRFLDHLARQHKVYLGCFYDDPGEEKNLDTLQKTCAEVHAERIARTPLNLKNLQALMKNEPVTLTHYRHARMRSWVMRKLSENPISAIFAFSGAMAQYLPPTPGAPRRVLDLVDLDSRKWQDYAAHSSWLWRWIYGREAHLLSNFEISAAKTADIVTFVSNFEANCLKDMKPQCADKIVTLPNGVIGILNL